MVEQHQRTIISLDLNCQNYRRTHTFNHQEYAQLPVHVIKMYSVFSGCTQFAFFGIINFPSILIWIKYVYIFRLSFRMLKFLCYKWKLGLNSCSTRSLIFVRSCKSCVSTLNTDCNRTAPSKKD